MRKPPFLFAVLAGCFILVLTGGALSSRVLAQVQSEPGYSSFQDPGQKLVTISFESEDVRDAIRKMFRSVDVPYSIAVEIQGTMTVNFKNVPLNQALTNMLSQVNGTFQVEGGVYQVILRQRRFSIESDRRDIASLVDSEKDGPAVMTSDAMYLYVLRGTMLYKVSKVDLKTVEMRRLGE